MKNRGLKNRFPESVRYEWQWWYACMVCGENRFDALHHIISPSMREYIDGKHNESIFNSSTIHNHKCHIGNEAWLHKNISLLLNKTYTALIDYLEYKPNTRDKKFISIYKNLYSDYN